MSKTKRRSKMPAIILYENRGEYDRVRLPEGKSNGVSLVHVEHDAGREEATANMRHALIGGQPRSLIKFEGPTLWHALKEDEYGTWMTDAPMEQAQHVRELANVRGRVLVGGLGLGVAVRVLRDNPAVDEIVVVERSPDVIRLVGKHTAGVREILWDSNGDKPGPVWPKGRDPGGKVTIVQACLFEFIAEAKASGEVFDFAFYDIWQSDGQGECLKTIVPLRQKSVGLVEDAHVICWNEDVMRGQFLNGLNFPLWAVREDALKGMDVTPEMVRELRKGKGSVWANWRAVFFRELDRVGLDWTDKAEAELVDRLVTLYVRWYGRPNWLPEFRAALSEEVK